MHVSLPLTRVGVTTEGTFPWLLDGRGFGTRANGMGGEARRTFFRIKISAHLLLASYSLFWL